MSDTNVPESGIADGNEAYAGWGADVDQQQPARRKRRRKKADFGDRGGLSINSLMDIVTIILVYLLKSYATSPIEVKDPAIELPVSTSTETVEEATVVMVTGPETKVPDPNNPAQARLAANTPTIVVDGTPILQLDPATYRVRNEDKDEKTGGYVIKALREKLRAAKDMQEASAEVSDKGGFTGKVVILADKRTPYRVLTDVLVTCGEAGFGEFKFAIVKDEG